MQPQPSQPQLSQPQPKPNDTRRDKRDAWRLMLEVHHRLTDDMDEELREHHGLRLDWYDVLVQLDEAGGRLRMSELADRTLFSRTDCTRIVDRMEGAGFVLREQATEDGRGVYAAITKNGRHLFREAARTHGATIERRFSSVVTPQEALAMANALRRVLEESGVS